MLGYRAYSTLKRASQALISIKGDDYSTALTAPGNSVFTCAVVPCCWLMSELLRTPHVNFCCERHEGLPIKLNMSLRDIQLIHDRNMQHRHGAGLYNAKVPHAQRIAGHCTRKWHFWQGPAALVVPGARKIASC